MPKIRIVEKDFTGKVQSSAISNVVYVPVKANTGINLNNGCSKDVAGSATAVKVFDGITLYRSASAFSDDASAYQMVESGVEGATSSVKTTVLDAQSLDYKLCVHLLNIGFEVLVEVIDNVSKSAPSWTLLEDKNLYDVRFLTLGNMTSLYATEASKMISTAAKRGDCLALVNADESDAEFSYSVSDVRAEFDGTNGEYAAAFTPWFKTKNGDFQNPGAAEKVEYVVPAAFGYLFAYANATKNCPEWYAIAGFERGIIPELTDVCHVYTTAEVEMLQARAANEEVELDDASDNVGYAINPICYVRPAGYIIYGNRTLKSNDASKKLTAQSFLNVRNGLSAIKKVMYEASKKYTFEQNTETLWINFQAYVTPLLDRMQTGNGILGYQFIRQKTDAKARLKARLNLVPIEAVEDFDLEVYLTDDLTVSE